MSALDRFARSVHRFHDRVAIVPDRHLRRELLRAGEQLEAALVAVRSQARTPPTRREEAAPTVRGLLRSGTLCAQATEGAVAAATAARNRDTDEAARHLDDVRAVVAALLVDLKTGGDPARRTEPQS